MLLEASEDYSVAQRAEKKILVRSAIAIVVIGLILTSIVGIPLYKELKEKTRQEVEFISKSKKLILDSYFSKITGIAEQIASRTKIRQKLIEYNEGKTTKDDVASFSQNLLLDALNSSDDAIGLIRYSKDGEMLVAPKTGALPDLKIDINVKENAILFPKEHNLIVIVSRIIDKSYGFCGTDVIFFDKKPLDMILKDYSGLGMSGELVLFIKNGGELRQIFEPRSKNGEFKIEPTYLERIDSEKTIFYEQNIDGTEYTNALFLLEEKKIIPLIRIKSDELYSIIDASTKRVLVISLIGIIFGVIAVYVLTYPLLKTISDELARRKETEMALQKINDELSQIVAVEIEKQREQEHMLVQQSKLASIGEMLGNVAHQWRQPLNALAGLVQNIDDAYEYNEVDKKYIEEFVAKGMRYIKKMSTTIDDFRNFFAPDKEKQVFSVSKCVEDAIHIIDASLGHNGIELTFNIIKESEIIGYPNEYSHAVLNILNNAKEALKDKLVGEKKIYIELSTNEDGKSLLKISDTGGGIDDAIVAKVFEPYFTTKHKAEGTGIGLYMVKVIIEKHMDGLVYVENSKDGATFFIEL